MKASTLFLTVCLVLLCACGHPTATMAQTNHSVDSIRFAAAEWRIDTLEGFYLKQYHFGEGTLFSAAQHLFLIEIPPRSHRRLAFVHDSARAPLSELATRHNAFAAINGSFFDMRWGHPVCYLRIDGRERGENQPLPTDSLHRKYYQYATLVLKDGRPHLLVPDSSRTWESALPDSNIMTAGPMLLREGIPVPQNEEASFVRHRHNRSALGIRPDGTTLLLVADGHFHNVAEGFSLMELTLVMRWLGCTEAINLDGGGSSTLFVHNKPFEGIVNYPIDNHRHDHLGQRPLSNAILVL